MVCMCTFCACVKPRGTSPTCLASFQNSACQCTCVFCVRWAKILAKKFSDRSRQTCVRIHLEKEYVSSHTSVCVGSLPDSSSHYHRGCFRAAQQSYSYCRANDKFVQYRTVFHKKCVDPNFTPSQTNISCPF